ncbi:BTAD domain-containing putative transcriptional regulator [Micromonospora sp. NPDC006766]|uniref:BTAD domain-containing putative transcriptional regulator n=1 Tax=Micromonospora sp. NPDC006766 TaxID=3154778 RepID=UPI0033CBCA6A
MSEALRFEILGPQRAWYADRPLDLGAGKQRSVLAVLLLSAGRPVPIGQIIEAVWPGESPANGPNVVQKYVAGLRRVLEPERSPRTPGQVLTLTDAGYLLRIRPEAVDAVRFERGVHLARQQHSAGRTAEAKAELTAALAMWQGEPFTGFAGPFFEAARHRLVELRAVALETRVELTLESGRHRELIGELVELVAEFPVRERLRHQLMLALYRSGRQAEALAAYREFADLLREEHGIEPGEALQELHGRMLRSDPTLTPDASYSGPPVLAAVGPDSVVTGSGSPVAARPLPGRAAPPSASAPAVAQADSGWPAATVPPGHPSSAFQPSVGLPRQEARRWIRTTATITGTAATLLSFGALTWAVVLAYALWRRSWRLALAGIGYLLLFASMFVIAINDASVDEDASLGVEGVYCLTAIALCWLVGAVHVVLLNPDLWSFLTRRHGAGQQRAVEQRMRREQARSLLMHFPLARYELRIGRPDLPRTFDDGGLVDVNGVPDLVLAALPGLTDGQRQRIVIERWTRGPYTSLEDLVARCPLPPAAADCLREILLFLPSSAPPVPPS